jgi:hypothetical protein
MVRLERQLIQVRNLRLERQVRHVRHVMKNVTSKPSFVLPQRMSLPSVLLRAIEGNDSSTFVLKQIINKMNYILLYNYFII